MANKDLTFETVEDGVQLIQRHFPAFGRAGRMQKVCGQTSATYFEQRFKKEDRPKNLAALNALHEALLEGALRHESTVEYVQRVHREIGSLGAGDRYTLVFGAPLLESIYEQIRAVVVAAARQGGELDYYFPAVDTIAGLSPISDLPQDGDDSKSTRSPARVSKRSAQFAARFGWLQDIDLHIRQTMRRLMRTAEAADAALAGSPSHAGSKTPHQDAVRSNIRFWETRLVPVLPTEKLVWIHRKNQPEGERDTFRKEALAPNVNRDELDIYDESQRWVSWSFPVHSAWLKCYLVTCAKPRALEWEEAQGSLPFSPARTH